MKSNSNVKPETIEAIGNGNYFFNYNIEEIEKEDGISYNYLQIETKGYPTYDSIVSTIIKENFSYDFREAAIRNGISNPNDEDFIRFNTFAENTKSMIKSLLK